DKVTLSVKATSPDGGKLKYQWVIVGETPKDLELKGAKKSTANFVTPEITQEQIIVPFKVTVSDKTGSNEGSVQVTINKAVTSATTPTNASIQATPNATNATAPPPAVIPPTEAPIVPGPNVTNATE